MSYRNRGIIQYTAAEKRAYYAKKRRNGRSRVSGRGDYKVRGSRGFVRASGRGDYKLSRAARRGASWGGDAGSAIGNYIAPGIGGTIGGALGAGLGATGGSLFKSITGLGDYTVHDNSLIFPDKAVPTFGEGSIRVRHREFITEINGTSDFTNQFFPLNPGLDEVFPWISRIAGNFEQYRINGMIFQFVSTSSDAIASTTDLGLGQVIMATDYNAADPPFVNAPQMLGSMFSNSSKPSENLMHAIECAPSDQAQKLYYIRTGSPASNTDIRMYDMGSFQVATQNMPADYTGMGQLWVSYDITFVKPIQNNQLGYNINTDEFEFVRDGTVCLPLEGLTINSGNNLGCFITNGDSNTSRLNFPITIASGYYLFEFVIEQSMHTSCLTPGITLNNCETISNKFNITYPSGSAEDTNVVLISLCVRLTDYSAYIEFDGTGVYPTEPNQLFRRAIVTQLNGEIFFD